MESQISRQVSVGVNLSPCWKSPNGTGSGLISLLAGGHMSSISAPEHDDNMQYFSFFYIATVYVTFKMSSSSKYSANIDKCVSILPANNLFSAINLLVRMAMKKRYKN